MSFKYRSTALILALSLATTAALAADLPESVEHFPVQFQGRVMPFHSFAREMVLAVTGRMKWEGENPAVTVMDWMAHPDDASAQQLIDVGYDPLRERAGLDMDRRRFSLNELLSAQPIMTLGSQASQKRSNDEKPTKLESEAAKVLDRMGNLYALTSRQLPLVVPPVGNPDGVWGAMGDREASSSDSVGTAIRAAVAGMLSSYGAGDIPQFTEFARHLDHLIRERWNPGVERLKRFDREIAYNKQRPVQLGRTLYLIALLLLLGSLVGWGRYLVPAAMVLITSGLVAHAYGLWLRFLIGNRAPWSNFYESLVTITAVLVLFGLLFAGKKLRGLVLGGVAFSGYFALLIADRAGLSPGVDTLVPALQSYWLNIHVIVILSGYAVAALAMVLGHVALGVEAFKPGDRSLFIATSNAVYRAVQMAMLLLFAGTVLGGVWAHEAWGRYWGWDPKETWALISWFGYLGVAHARFAGWLKPRGMALAAIAVFPLVLMTYYGVNYLLSGLHSYAGGESAAVPPLLIGFLAFETVVVVAGIRGWHLKLGGGKSGGAGKGPGNPAKRPTKAAASEPPEPTVVGGGDQ